jgi:hypothetical protein
MPDDVATGRGLPRRSERADAGQSVRAATALFRAAGAARFVWAARFVRAARAILADAAIPGEPLRAAGLPTAG